MGTGGMAGGAGGEGHRGTTWSQYSQRKLGLIVKHHGATNGSPASEDTEPGGLRQ